MTERLTQWSYSRYGLWKQCPFKAKLQYIEKLKEPSSPALENGIKVHSELESYLKGDLAEVPLCSHKLKGYMTSLKEAKPHSELEVAFNTNWQPVEWFSKDAWVRIKIDALVKTEKAVKVIDFKTGKIRDTYGDQLELYALTGLLMFPSAEQAETELAFVDHGKVVEGTIWARDSLEELRALWMDRVSPMLEDTHFEATPNAYCFNCSFSKKKGGPCKAA